MFISRRTAIGGDLTLICRHAAKSGDGFIVAEMPASARDVGSVPEKFNGRAGFLRFAADADCATIKPNQNFDENGRQS
jgi:hypothetical protein